MFLLVWKATEQETAICYHNVKEKISPELTPFSSPFSQKTLLLCLKWIFCLLVFFYWLACMYFSCMSMCLVVGLILFLTCDSVLYSQMRSCRLCRCSPRPSRLAPHGLLPALPAPGTHVGPTACRLDHAAVACCVCPTWHGWVCRCR